MRADRELLSKAIQNNKIPEIIVGYLKLQQAKNEDFFTLFLEKKINGRLFYNTCLPNGTKEVRYGNEDFLHDDFRDVIDKMLAPFNSVTLDQVRSEFIKPTVISDSMNTVITSFLKHIESTRVWKTFWEKEIQINCSAAEKKQLYNLIASTAAYKALVSCIDHSKYILDPPVKRNVAVLIGICTGKYESQFLKPQPDFQLKTKNTHKKIPTSHQGTGDFNVFNTQTCTHPRRKYRKKKVIEAELEAEGMALK